MFKNKLHSILSIVLLLIVLFAGYEYYHASQTGKNDEKKMTVGIIMPMDHMALREMVSGFQETLAKTLPDAVVKVQNAQGDTNLQRSIIQKFINEKVQVLVPIGTAATQMTVSMVNTQPIVSLAADYTKTAVQDHPNLTGVLDEIGEQKPLDFMKVVLPELKKITLIYSNSEKVFPEVAALMAYAPQKGLEVQKMMIQSLPDLYTIAHRIDPDSQAIFILKDNLIASGIRTILQEAQKRSIPVIASDEGSVAEGALFALGIKEKAVGMLGAEQVREVLQGKTISDLPVIAVKQLSLFYNETTGKALNIDTERLKRITFEHQYEWVPYGSH